MSEIVLPDYIQDHLNRIAAENEFLDYSVEVKQGSETGDGFLSDLSSITISNRKSDKQLHLVCKMAPLNRNRRKEFALDRAFAREAAFYTKLMPIFAKFQDEKNLSKNDQFFAYPKCYGATIDDDHEQYAIILEDLRSKQFKMWNKAKTSPYQNVELAIREIGKFHGLSIAMKDQRPIDFAEFEKFTDLYQFYFKSKNVQDTMTEAYDHAIASLKCEDHKNIVRLLKQHFFEYFGEQSTQCLGVICHGDIWNNNILYKFNENDTAEDIRIIDWQFLRYGSPAIDVVYNIFTSTDKALRDKEYDNLIRLYYETLRKTIKLLGSNPELITFEQLQSELERCSIYALLHVPLLIQIAQADSSELTNLDEMCDGGNASFVNGLNEKAQREYEKRLNDIFDDATRLGYFKQIKFS